MTQDPQDKGRDIKARMQGSVHDYIIAHGGDGPLGAEWQNKPHRLIYDLCGTVQELEQQRDVLTAHLRALVEKWQRAIDTVRADQSVSVPEVAAKLGHRLDAYERCMNDLAALLPPKETR